MSPSVGGHALDIPENVDLVASRVDFSVKVSLVYFRFLGGLVVGERVSFDHVLGLLQRSAQLFEYLDVQHFVGRARSCILQGLQEGILMEV